MPTKTTATGREYEVDGRKFTWHPLDDDGETLPDVTIPLRIKLKVIRAMADQDMDAKGMFDMLEAIAPGQSETFDEMDVNDFQAMFLAWQAEYQILSGASLGE